MKTRPEIERSFYNEELYEYAYFTASHFFYSNEEALWEGGSIGFRVFYDIQAGNTKFPFTKEDYIQNKDIQEALALIGLDSEKFWHALLFVYSFAFCRNIGGIPVEPSVQDQILDIIRGISEEKTDVHIVIKRPGKKTTNVCDSKTLEFVSLFLRHEDSLFSFLQMPEYVGRGIQINKEKVDLGIRWVEYDIYCALKCIFDAFCKDDSLPTRVKDQQGSRDKVLLVSRLLFLTKVVLDGKYLNSKNPLKSVIGKCSDTPRPQVDVEFAYHG